MLRKAAKERDDQLIDSAIRRKMLELIGEESMLQQMLDSSPDGIVLVNGYGIIVRANRTAERMFGWPPSGIRDVPLEELIPHRYRAAHRQHRVRYQANPELRPMGLGLDLWGLRADGTEFPVEISLSETETAKRWTVAAVRDMTARQ